MRNLARSILVGVAASLASCRAPPEVPALPTPTPPPSVTVGSPAHVRDQDGKVQYHLVIRADAGVAFLPISVTALSGTGSISWTRWTDATFAYDDAANRFLPAPAAEGGEKREEWVNVVFPGSNQELGIDVTYRGEPPREERFEVVYASLAIGELATSVYVKPEKVVAGRKTEKVAREPLGDRLRSVDVSRWLSGGFFVTTGLHSVDKVIVTVPGVKRDVTASKESAR